MEISSASLSYERLPTLAGPAAHSKISTLLTEFFNGPFLLSDQRVAALLLLLLQRHGACASGRNVKGTEVMHSVNRYWQY